MVGKYKVITLCGSTKFKEQYLEAQKRLTLEGNIVISVGLFGHGGAWGTSCSVNYHKKELRMWVVQRGGGKEYEPWKADMDKAAEKFFMQNYDQSDIAAYTGRSE